MTYVYINNTVYVTVNSIYKINTVREITILEELKEKFSKLAKVPGLRLKKSAIDFSPNYQDATLELSYGKNSFKLACYVINHVRTITIENTIRQINNLQESRKKYKHCLITPYLSKNFRELCRKNEISYIDLSGNIFICIPEILYLERGGELNKYKESTKLTGLFSDKKSFTIRYLFENPSKYCGVREIASACSINPGGVSTTLKSLEKIGYIVRNFEGKGKLLRWKELLADWASFYKLKKQKEFSFYWHKKSLEQMIKAIANKKLPKESQMALTLHAGAFLVDPHTNYQKLHAYVPGHSDIVYWKRELNLEQVDEGANCFLQIPYYRHSVFFGSKNIKGVHVVSPVQLYLDLINFPVRGEEQAEHLLNNIIEPCIKKGK